MRPTATADSAPVPMMEGGMRMPSRRVVWDPTINVTHVVNFALGLIAVVGVYYNLDKRISKQEDMAPIVEKARTEKDAAVQHSLTSLATDVKEVKTVVDKVSRALDVQNAVSAAQEKRK